MARVAFCSAVVAASIAGLSSASAEQLTARYDVLVASLLVGKASVTGTIDECFPTATPCAPRMAN
jgi:hypothetical protein